ncbi:FtsX-like permease family protein [Crossiella cryophila]|uniref:Putative ABC transport system permease protein n=1 Tax=Crossiella cryophila TaxID=43355 RepID=A0A7W7CGT5_9PSEU|nr:FtsX-like permease family protein [Crossiella cryophila]MBB4680687.1 putative ABC transport system permease protein [Crossiella cryophila]
MARSPLLRTVIQEIKQRPTRLLLTGLAVVVATMFAAASLMFTDTMRVALTNSASKTPEAAAAVLSPKNEYDPQHPDKPGTDHTAAIKAVPGVAEVAPEGAAYLASPTDSSQPWRVVADTPGALARATLLSGKMPVALNEVGVSEATAKREDLKIGSTVTLAGERGAKAATLTVTGVVKLKGGGDRTLVAPPATVRALEPRSSWYTYELTATPGTSPEQLVAAVKAKFGPAMSTVRTGAEQRKIDTDRLGSAADQALMILSVFTGLSMLAAALVVASTFRIVVAQRRRRTALMRCVGASRRQVLRALLTEAGISGFVAGLLGGGLALALGYGTLAIVNTQVEDPLPPLQVSWLSLALCVLAATVVTVIAAVGPAVQGTKVPPVAALGAARVSEAGTGRSKARIVFMVLFTLAAIGLLFVKLGDTLNLLTVVGSGVFAFGALILGGPLLMPLLARLFGAPIRKIGGVPGRIAVGNALRVPKRTAATTVVLTMGVGLIAAVLVGLSSAQAGAIERLDARYPAKLVVESNDSEGLSAAAIKTLDDLPESGPIGKLSSAQLALSAPGGSVDRIYTVGADVAGFPALTKGRVEGGKLTDLGKGKAGVSLAVADKYGVKVGDKITVTGPGGKLELPVAVVYRDAATLGGVSLFPSDLAQIAPKAEVSQLLIDPVAGSDVDKLRKAVGAVAGSLGGIRVVVPEDMKKELASALNTMTYVALGLVGMTVLVAVVGVAVTLSLSVVERTQESGLLRAMGLSRGGLRAALAWEAVVFGACAAVVGLGLGGLYGGLAVQSLELFGSVTVPWLQLGAVGLGLVALALVAAVGPARRSARVSPLEALVAD